MIFNLKSRHSTRNIRRHTFRPNRDKFIIAGRVIRKLSGDGIGGLTVRALDYDRTYDDPAGVACSDELGFFRIEYPRARFVETDHDPELYIDVSDESDRILYISSPRRVRCGSVELVNISLADSVHIVGKERIIVGGSRSLTFAEKSNRPRHPQPPFFIDRVRGFTNRLRKFRAYQKRLMK